MFEVKINSYNLETKAYEQYTSSPDLQSKWTHANCVHIFKIIANMIHRLIHNRDLAGGFTIPIVDLMHNYVRPPFWSIPSLEYVLITGD